MDFMFTYNDEYGGNTLIPEQPVELLNFLRINYLNGFKVNSRFAVNAKYAVKAMVSQARRMRWEYGVLPAKRSTSSNERKYSGGEIASRLNKLSS